MHPAGAGEVSRPTPGFATRDRRESATPVRGAAHVLSIARSPSPLGLPRREGNDLLPLAHACRGVRGFKTTARVLREVLFPWRALSTAPTEASSTAATSPSRRAPLEIQASPLSAASRVESFEFRQPLGEVRAFLLDHVHTDVTRQGRAINVLIVVRDMFLDPCLGMSLPSVGVTLGPKWRIE